MKLKIERVVKSWEFAEYVIPASSGYIYNPAGGRRYAPQDTAEHWLKAFAAFSLVPACVEPKYTNFTGHHFCDGTFIQKHVDIAPDGFVHVRCNLMLQKPKIGGNPIIDSEEIEIDVGDLWLCLASLESHASSPIFGGDRMIFSFGGLVREHDIQSILA